MLWTIFCYICVMNTFLCYICVTNTFSVTFVLWTLFCYICVRSYPDNTTVLFYADNYTDNSADNYTDNSTDNSINNFTDNSTVLFFKLNVE